MRPFIFLLPILFLFSCEDNNSNKPKPEKPEEVSFNHILVEDLSPSMKDDGVFVSLYTADGEWQELPAIRHNLKVGKAYTDFKLIFPKPDQRFVIGIRNSEENLIASKFFNIWERIKRKEPKDNDIYFINIQTTKMTFEVKLTALY
jgi:hypothetical protein